MNCSKQIATTVGVMVTLMFAHPGYGQKHQCTEGEGRAALEAVTLHSWDALYKSYKSSRLCDDGAIGEGYSESVARILSDHWNTLPRLSQLAGKDADFRAFVIRHLDATLNMDDVEKIKKSANAQCPRGLRTLCDDLAKQADSALKENASTP